MKIVLNKNFIIILVASFVMSSCSNSINKSEMQIWDPLEPINRGIFSFNMIVDTYTLEPLAKGYDYITPEFAKTGFRNHFKWIETPKSVVNSALQGKYEDSFVSILDFSINALTLGFIDLTKKYPDPDREDFDQTLALYKFPTGPYIILPFAGPSTFRGIGSSIVDGIIDPLNLIGIKESTKLKSAELPLKAIDSRSKYMDEINNLKNNSLDPYSLFRSVYFQRLKAEINDEDLDNSNTTNVENGARDAFFMQN